MSDMYLLRVTDETEPLVAGEYTGPIYTGQVRPTLRIYACTNCNSQYMVGGEAGGQFATIEALKESGCPNCGNRDFRLVSKRGAGTNGAGGAEAESDEP